jgi:hypothetical protein
MMEHEVQGRSGFVIRHSSFVIRHSSFSRRTQRLRVGQPYSFLPAFCPALLPHRLPFNSHDPVVDEALERLRKHEINRALSFLEPYLTELGAALTF